jgi:hypothetical protein
MLHLKLFPITRKESLKAHHNLPMSGFTPTSEKKKNNIEGTIKISVRPPHQTNHVLSNQEEGGMHVHLSLKNEKDV